MPKYIQRKGKVSIEIIGRGSCGRCGRRPELRLSRRELKNMAAYLKRLGWRFNRTEGWICPYCVLAENHFTGKNKIGLSISMCIRDIVEGRVKERNVLKIISRVSAHTPEDWERIIHDYKRDEWSRYAIEADKILRRLLKKKKIEQPRNTHGKEPVLIEDIRWVNDEKLIRWQPRPASPH